jgi:hypothetical protein
VNHFAWFSELGKIDNVWWTDLFVRVSKLINVHKTWYISLSRPRTVADRSRPAFWSSVYVFFFLRRLVLRRTDASSRDLTYVTTWSENRKQECADRQVVKVRVHNWRCSSNWLFCMHVHLGRWD